MGEGAAKAAWDPVSRSVAGTASIAKVANQRECLIVPSPGPLMDPYPVPASSEGSAIWSADDYAGPYQVALPIYNHSTN